MDDSDFQYRKLIVWQEAMLFSKVVYELINQFPAAEKYALSDQVRRAAVSVPSNIAEDVDAPQIATMLISCQSRVAHCMRQ